VDVGLFHLIDAVKGKKISIFCRFELENMSKYETLPALDLTQSVHAKYPSECTRGSYFKFPEYL
jgi:hypothetical protein